MGAFDCEICCGKARVGAIPHLAEIAIDPTKWFVAFGFQRIEVADHPRPTHCGSPYIATTTVRLKLFSDQTPMTELAQFCMIAR